MSVNSAGSAAPRETDEQVDLDLIIIGAGIAGINAAYRYQEGAPVGRSYTVLEARESIGGTWDLFRYPGIRSDSDIFTFAFEWNPWPRKEALANGADIKQYLIDSTTKTGINRHIRLGHKVISISWQSEYVRWQVVSNVSSNDKPTVLYSRFIYLATGYYDYEEPMKATIPGIDQFQGKVLHPQFWPEDYDYSDDNVVVIGSGATAVTIVPSMADKAKHVTMLQRSPTYIFPLPSRGALSVTIFTLLPWALAYSLHRIGWILQTIFMIAACRAWPNLSRRYIRWENSRLLPAEVSWDPHFNPRYNPWEQRLCASKDGDIFAALRAGKASVVTDTIMAVTKDSIQLMSGATLYPDTIVTATGLKLLFAGGMTIDVDGKAVDYANAFLWHGTMLQDVPNLFFTIGFENAAWTLGCDCAARLAVRVMRDMNTNGNTSAVARLDAASAKTMEPRPLFSLSATYLKSVNEQLPKGGTGVWSPRSNYLVDMWKTQYGDITTALEVN